MGDKSPKDAHHSNKSSKTIKEKRAEKKAKAVAPTSQMDNLTHGTKKH